MSKFEIETIDLVGKKVVMSGHICTTTEGTYKVPMGTGHCVFGFSKMFGPLFYKFNGMPRDPQPNDGPCWASFNWWYRLPPSEREAYRIDWG